LRAASASLGVAGLAAVLLPARVGDSMGFGEVTSRGLTEIRAGLGATYVALAAYALVTDDLRVHRAVGATWLGAAAARTIGLAQDRPHTDAVYWGSLALELGAGVGALVASQE
jgi:hypothetical protein